MLTIYTIYSCVYIYILHVCVMHLIILYIYVYIHIHMYKIYAYTCDMRCWKMAHSDLLLFANIPQDDGWVVTRLKHLTPFEIRWRWYTGDLTQFHQSWGVQTRKTNQILVISWGCSLLLSCFTAKVDVYFSDISTVLLISLDLIVIYSDESDRNHIDYWWPYLGFPNSLLLPYSPFSPITLWYFNVAIENGHN